MQRGRTTSAGRGWWSLADVGRDHRTDLGMEVVRTASALLTVVLLTTGPELPSSVSRPAVLAHLGLVAVSVGVLLALPAAVRAGRARSLGLAVTALTVVFYVATTALWHDVAGAGTALGLVALVEAPLRYGWRGAALSAVPVLSTALRLPQVDASGDTLPEGVVVALVALLLVAALTVRDLTRRSLAAVHDAAHGFAEAMLHLPLGVAVLDEHGLVVQANPALIALVGPEVSGARLADRLTADDAEGLSAVLRGTAPDARVLCRTPGGRDVSVGATAVRVTGPRRTVVHLQDVTDERRERADLLHASRHDALTGLLTRAAGTAVLTESLAGQDPVAVLFVDLDGFKRLNDTAGHAVGDTVLRQVATRLSRALRPSEHAVRWGGDEFVVVCSGAADAAAMGAVAERLLAVVREPYRAHAQGLVTLTASIGAVRAPPGSSLQAVLAAADAAMYAAKRAGGDRWVAPARSVPAPRGGDDAPSRLRPG
jgi:diguanylate cyclase (GGDEF)-like protein